MNHKQLFDLVTTTGGFTYNLETRDTVSTGYAVSTRKGFEKVYPQAEFHPDIILDYVIHYAEVFNKPGNCLGAWVDDCKVYLDVSTVVADAATAKALCFEHDQLAYFDLAKGETVYVQRACPRCGQCIPLGDDDETGAEPCAKCAPLCQSYDVSSNGDVPSWVPEHSVDDWYDAKPWVREVYVLLHQLCSTADENLFDCVNGLSTIFGSEYALWVRWETDWSYTAKQFREDFLKIERIAPSQSAVYAMAHALEATVERLTSK